MDQKEQALEDKRRVTKWIEGADGALEDRWNRGESSVSTRKISREISSGAAVLEDSVAPELGSQPPHEGKDLDVNRPIIAEEDSFVHVFLGVMKKDEDALKDGSRSLSVVLIGA